mmetsp:Transcript_2869/g.11408  ORF Transcript_2869/g.11408 Transcript_2869/m.11408 type:complete len:287 (-) Transcript_2869:21-881(-)
MSHTDGVSKSSGARKGAVHSRAARSCTRSAPARSVTEIRAGRVEPKSMSTARSPPVCSMDDSKSTFPGLTSLCAKGPNVSCSCKYTSAKQTCLATLKSCFIVNAAPGGFATHRSNIVPSENTGNTMCARRRDDTAFDAPFASTRGLLGSTSARKSGRTLGWSSARITAISRSTAEFPNRAGPERPSPSSSSSSSSWPSCRSTRLSAKSCPRASGTSRTRYTYENPPSPSGLCTANRVRSTVTSSGGMICFAAASRNRYRYCSPKAVPHPACASIGAGEREARATRV